MKKNIPTDSEMDILNIIWQKKEASVKDVQQELLKHKEVGYTTVLKLIQIMYEKGLLDRYQKGKSHVYSALVNKKEIQKSFLNKITEKVYNGSSFNLVMNALGNYNASSNELEQIKQLIKQQEDANELQEKKSS